MMDTVLNIGLNDETAIGLSKQTEDERFVYDSYRRLIQMFGSVVMGIPDDIFEKIIEKEKKAAGVERDSDFTAEAWKTITTEFKAAFRKRALLDFPTDPYEQLKKEAVLRVTPEQVDFFLHPQFDSRAIQSARQDGTLQASGLNVSPGAACGIVALDADLAETWGKAEGKQVIMVRPETRPDDVHGMLAAQGILTSRGGRTSHAALVARQFGKPAVVGVSELVIDMTKRQIRVGSTVIREGDWLSIDGNTGEVFTGSLKTTIPDIQDKYLIKLLEWADEFRRLGVWANADYPADATRAREYGAQGIGLCRSEHMFFEADRLPLFQKMIMAGNRNPYSSVMTWA